MQVTMILPFVSVRRWQESSHKDLLFALGSKRTFNQNENLNYSQSQSQDDDDDLNIVWRKNQEITFSHRLQ